MGSDPSSSRPSPEVRCPRCREPSAPRAENKAAPFCSERCRLIDLGSWLDEGYRIPDPDGSAPPDE